MVVGRKAKLPSLLIFISVNRRAGSESVGVLLSTECLYAGIASWILSFS